VAKAMVVQYSLFPTAKPIQGHLDGYRWLQTGEIPEGMMEP